MRHFFIRAVFPELEAAHAEQCVNVEATRLEVAAKRGLQIIRNRNHIKGRCLNEASLRISVVRPAHPAKE
jgi:hypothetical protein